MNRSRFARLLALALILCLVTLFAVSCGSKEEGSSAPITEPSSESSSVVEVGYDFSRPVPRVAGDWARKSYFNDAVFIGDSVTTGLTIYSFFENATVLAERGIDPQNITTKEIASLDKTIMEALADEQFGKVYIMLGANAAVYMSTEEYIQSFETMLDEIIRLQPNAIIYLQAAFPITKALSDSNASGSSGLTNERIMDYNAALLTLAQKKQVYYVNTFEALAGEGGYLPAAYSSDGVHINAAQYQNWYDYLRSHVVED